VGEDLKARLLARRETTGSGMPEDTVDVAGMGVVHVRGLSRGEVFAMQKSRADGGIKDEAAWERRMLHLCLLDPVMTEDEVGAWQRVSPAGEMEPVGEKIRDLSGLSDGVEKAAVQSFRGESGPGVRVLPGAEAGADGGPAAGADEQ
jgi:hypothetical protein